MATKSEEKVHVVIEPPNFKFAKFTIVGTHPLVMARWSEKVKEDLRKVMEAGSVAKISSKGGRKPKDFGTWKSAAHVSTEGWYGIPCTALRAAMISACKVAGLEMTRAKLAVFVESAGFELDGTALVKITKGEPYQFITPVRNATGVVDMRSRPRWNPGWEAEVVIQYDADVLDGTSIANLLHRAGVQVGLLEGRPDSKKSTGQDWGRFRLSNEGGSDGVVSTSKEEK